MKPCKVHALWRCAKKGIGCNERDNFVIAPSHQFLFSKFCFRLGNFTNYTHNAVLQADASNVLSFIIVTTLDGTLAIMKSGSSVLVVPDSGPWYIRKVYRRSGGS